MVAYIAKLVMFLAFQKGAVICCGLDCTFPDWLQKRTLLIRNMLQRPQFKLPIA